MLLGWLIVCAISFQDFQPTVCGSDPGDPRLNFLSTPIISGTGKATNFKFCMHVHRIDRIIGTKVH